MKASEMVEQLKGLIEEHGDSPLALTEVSGRGVGIYVEIDGVEGVHRLDETEVLYDTYDDVSAHRKVFLLD